MYPHPLRFCFRFYFRHEDGAKIRIIFETSQKNKSFFTQRVFSSLFFENCRDFHMLSVAIASIVISITRCGVEGQGLLKREYWKIKREYWKLKQKYCARRAAYRSSLTRLSLKGRLLIARGASAYRSWGVCLSLMTCLLIAWIFDKKNDRRYSYCLPSVHPIFPTELKNLLKLLTNGLCNSKLYVTLS